jgi:hypothetical protein
MSNCLREVISFWKTAPFLLFHNCQQHSAMNMLCCCWGTALTLMLEWMSYAANPFCGPGTPKTSQNSAAFMHWNNRCSVVSSGEPQIVHPGLSTACFLKRFALRILYCWS